MKLNDEKENMNETEKSKSFGKGAPPMLLCVLFAIGAVVLLGATLFNLSGQPTREGVFDNLPAFFFVFLAFVLSVNGLSRIDTPTPKLS